MTRATIATQYDRNAGRYEDAARFNRMAGERLVGAVPPGEYPRLLDVGCGTGFATLAACPRLGVREVHGVDISAEMIARFRENVGALPGVTVRAQVADVATFAAEPGGADLALCAMALHWFEDRAGAIAAMARALRPGGVLGLVAPGPGHDAEYVALLRSLRPPVPAAVHGIFGKAEIYPEVVEEWLAVAGAEPLDIWVESRARRVSPEAYLARITTVGSHVWAAIMDPPAQERMLAQIAEGLQRIAGPRGFEYTFTKTFAVARTSGRQVRIPTPRASAA